MATKVLVSFPENFLVEIDRLAAQENRSRSELIREALRAYMENRRARILGMKTIAEQMPAYQAEARARDAVSGEALTEFASSLAGKATRTSEQQEKIDRAIAFMDEISKVSPGRGEDSTEFIRHWRQKRRGE